MKQLQETRETVVKIIAEKLKKDPNEIADGATLHDLGADSLDIVEIIMNIEETCSINIDDARAEKLGTIKDVIEYVHSLCLEKR